MNCDKFERRIQDLMDRREDLARDSQLIDHAHACSNCFSRWQVWSQMNQACTRQAFGYRDGQAFASWVIEELGCKVEMPESVGEELTPSDHLVTGNREVSSVRRLGTAVALAFSLAIIFLSTGPAELGVHSESPSVAATSKSAAETPSDNLQGREVKKEARSSSLVAFHWRDLDYQAFANLGGESMSVVDPMVRPIRLAYVLVQRGLLLEASRSDDAKWQNDDRLKLILDYVA
jgi:hypothetical protein